MSTYEEPPMEPTSSVVDETDVRLVRSRYAEGQPVAVSIRGTYIEGNTRRSATELTIGDRDKLRDLIVNLLLAYHGWPRGTRT